MSALERFTAKYEVVENGCWLWTAYVMPWRSTQISGGYGRFRYKGRMWMAHRWSYNYFVGLIPNNLLVCHTCDNRKCVNPYHLFLGSYQDNMDDMVKKKRQNSPTKLTDKDIINIRIDARTGSEIAKDYNVTKCHINQIKSKMYWKNI